jgi:hypothetical protein
MRTEADDQLDLAREHVQESLRALTNIVVLDCSGSDEYSDAFRARMIEAHDLILKVKALLK